MLLEVRPSRSRIAAPITWAWVAGIAGSAANVFLVAFFVLALGLGPPQYGWLGTANDALIIIAFLALVPVATALRDWLPARRSVRVVTAVAVAGMVAVAVLQLMLILRVLTFDVQVLLVTAAFLPVYGWVLTVSSVGHRSGALPRPVTRFGLIVSVSFPIGLLIFAASVPFGWGSAAQLPFAVAGGVFSGFSWLALPIWWLLLAGLVFPRAHRTSVPEKGEPS